MKLIACDRCSAHFKPDVRHSEVWLFDDMTEDELNSAPPATAVKELCPVCRRDLRDFFNGFAGVPERVGPRITPEREPEPTAKPEQPAPNPDAQNLDGPPAADAKRVRDIEQRTCEICGRVGTRRFVETETGWRCAPSATACKGNKPAEKPKPAVAQSPPPQRSNATAHCQDCTRSWQLTGRPLEMAVEQHENKHSHIVTVYEKSTA